MFKDSPLPNCRGIKLIKISFTPSAGFFTRNENSTNPYLSSIAKDDFKFIACSSSLSTVNTREDKGFCIFNVKAYFSSLTFKLMNLSIFGLVRLGFIMIGYFTVFVLVSIMFK